MTATEVDSFLASCQVSKHVDAEVHSAGFF